MKLVPINGARLNVRDCGKGTPLLLVHGFPLNHQMWNRQIEFFSDSHRVIAPDLRGFGASSVTEGTVTMQQFADDLAQLLDALEITEQVIFCGLSMGGYIAWQFWHRFASRLLGLVLCDTRSVADTEQVARGRALMASQVLEEGPQSVAQTMLPKLLAESTMMENTELVEQVQNMILSTPLHGIAAAGRGMAVRPDETSTLENISVPSLVIVGRYDSISTSAEMRNIADTIPNCRFDEIPEAGHMAPMENPSAANAAMNDFFQSL